MAWLTLAFILFWAAPFLEAQSVKGWTRGRGYGWVWGKSDETGALNAVTGPQHVLRALGGVKTGRVFDLGVRVDRTSYKW
ncbi:MAG: hypothetical protein KJZ78_19150, partial [Bryobacteraceae bacterium]|nr:hypothetical protein [Bryobacteraceae bacterium]